MTRALILLLLLASPGWAQEYPPESAPLLPPETALRTLGWVFEDAPPVVADGEPVTIDVLCVTASGVDTAKCQRGIDRTNTTARNSGQGHVTVRLVGVFPTTYVSSGSSSTDLSRLYSPNDGHLDAVHVERQRLAADTVVLIGTSGDSCGLAYLHSTASSAFAYVFQDCLSNSSFEHEWGHNVGMNHDRPNVSGGATSTATNFGWCFGNGFKDVLTYPSPCGGSRAQFYSNPDVSYGGVPTGNALNNNALVLRQRAATMAAFRQSQDTPAAPGKPVPTLED